MTSRRRFPDPRRAPADGLLAVGVDLSPDVLVEAYAHGIFPWFSDDRGPTLWWCPDPRTVLFPERLRVSRSLARRLRRGDYAVTYDAAFRAVIAACAKPREPNDGTWITPRMQRAYCRLHQAGFAHSVEAWRNGELVGGLYGVVLGSMFFGESMFAAETDASKVALAHLAQRLRASRFELIDCQLPNPHLASLGAQAMPRSHFLDRIERNRGRPTLPGSWNANAC